MSSPAETMSDAEIQALLARAQSAAHRRAPDASGTLVRLPQAMPAPMADPNAELREAVGARPAAEDPSDVLDGHDDGLAGRDAHVADELLEEGFVLNE